MVWDGFQEAYIKLKKNEVVDWTHYDNRFKPLEYQYTHEEFKKIEEVMKGKLELVQIVKIFKDQTSYAFFQIQLAFCCHMYDLDGTSFVTSAKFASMINKFLKAIPGRQRCPLNVFFKIKPDFIQPYFEKFENDAWFDTTYKLFAFFGALPVFYMFLLKTGVIDMKTMDMILSSIVALRTELEKVCSDTLWKFNFIKKLKQQLNTLIQSYQDAKSLAL